MPLAARWTAAAGTFKVAGKDITVTRRSDASLPVVKGRLGGNYKTQLSVDGGGARCMLSVSLLGQVERQIKETLVANDIQLTEDGDKVMSVDEFDVRLGDYFDLVSGVSMGSIIAAYIATNGEGSDGLVEETSFKEGCKDKFLEVAAEAKRKCLGDDKFVDGVSVGDAKSLKAQYTNAADDDAKADVVESISSETINKSFPPGSMRRLEVAFRHCIETFFVSKESLVTQQVKDDESIQKYTRKVEEVTRAAGFSTDRIAKRFQDAIIEDRLLRFAPESSTTLGPGAFFKLIVGDKRMDEVQTNLVVTTVDVSNSRVLCFAVKKDTEDGSVRICVREEGWLDDACAITDSGNNQQARVEVTGQTDLPSLTGLTSASASVPGLFDPVLWNIAGVGPAIIFDGALGSNDPSPSAAAAMADPLMPYYAGDAGAAWDPVHMATLSVGSGLRGIDPQTHQPPSIPRNDDQQDQPYFAPLIQYMETSSRFIPAILIAFLEYNHQYKEGQYTRLQVSAKTPEEALALAEFATARNIGTLYAMGAAAVGSGSTPSTDVAKRIEVYVKEYIFGVRP